LLGIERSVIVAMRNHGELSEEPLISWTTPDRATVGARHRDRRAARHEGSAAAR